MYNFFFVEEETFTNAFLHLTHVLFRKKVACPSTLYIITCTVAFTNSVQYKHNINIDK